MLAEVAQINALAPVIQGGLGVGLEKTEKNQHNVQDPSVLVSLIT